MKRYFFLSILPFAFSAQAFDQTSFDTKALSQHPYWLKLGHYLPAIKSAFKSTVDTKEFFLSDHGKISPQLELEATINALYSKNLTMAKQVRCQFPARYTWLESQRGHEAKLDCPTLNDWETTLDPERLTLIFPTAYMNNPSSMFGHTLLRIDTKNQHRSKDLVAFAVNFAAEPDPNDNPALFAVKGLIGSYPGSFTVMPYYRKVREYNDIESRDIWEYPLTFSPIEVKRVLLHLWELQLAKFDYYFLDENCSYQLLGLLQLANDSLNLVEHFELTAAPSDTVKALVDANLITEPIFRESFGTRLYNEYQQLNPNLFDAAVLAKQGIMPSSAQFTRREQAAILEFAYEWLNFDLYDSGLERDQTAKRLTQLLRQRSLLRTASPFVPTQQPDVSPEQGHGSSRIGIGAIHDDADHSALSLEWRASYHDLLDYQAGFIPGAKISFLDTEFQYREKQTLELNHLYVVDAMALAPSNAIFESLAWDVKIGYEHLGQEHIDRKLIKMGFGKAWGNPDTLHTYSLVSGEVSHGTFSNNALSLGIGLESGLLYSINNQHRVGLNTNWMTQYHAQTANYFQAKASWNWAISTNMALRTDIAFEDMQVSNWQMHIRGYLYY
jgi:hypothetical protein